MGFDLLKGAVGESCVQQLEFFFGASSEALSVSRGDAHAGNERGDFESSVVLRCVLANQVFQALRQLLSEVQGHRRCGFAIV